MTWALPESVRSPCNPHSPLRIQLTDAGPLFVYSNTATFSEQASLPSVAFSFTVPKDKANPGRPAVALPLAQTSTSPVDISTFTGASSTFLEGIHAGNPRGLKNKLSTERASPFAEHGVQRLAVAGARTIFSSGERLRKSVHTTMTRCWSFVPTAKNPHLLGKMVALATPSLSVLPLNDRSQTISFRPSN